MRVALDTNILAYAEGVGDAPRCAGAIRLIEQLPAELVLLPAQTLGELFRVLTGKAKREIGLAREAIMTWAIVLKLPIHPGRLSRLQWIWQLITACRSGTR